MRLEFSQKIQDLTEEEIYRRDEMNIQPKDKRHKWRKVFICVDYIFGIYECNEKETLIDYDGELIAVKGSYEEIKSRIVSYEQEESKDEEKEEDR